ncbi:MAG: MFS transporter [Deltaproteobacteria bacterium]|nr:MFS transporter [Deltaproteobacteria bacterium]
MNVNEFVLSEDMTAEQRRKNLFVLAAGAFLRGAHTSIYLVIWQPFALSLGASMPMVGLLTSLGGLHGVFTTLSQSVGGWLADRVGCKPFIITASFFLIAAYSLFMLADLSVKWVLLLFGIVLFGLASLARPAVTSMTAEAAKRERQGSVFSLMMFVWVVPGVLAPTVGGWLTMRWGYAGVFPILIALEVIALVLTWRFLFERRHSWEGVSLSAFGRAFLRSVIPPRGLEWFFIAAAADSFVWALGWGLINGLLKDAHHFTVAQLGVMASVMAFAWAVVQLPIGRYLDSHTAKGTIVISEIFGIPIMIFTMIHPSFPIMIAMEVLFAIVAATWVPAVNTYIARAVKASERTEAFGRLNMFRGIIAFPSSWLGGLLYAKWGFNAPLAASLAGVFIVLAIFVFCVKEPQQTE